MTGCAEEWSAQPRTIPPRAMGPPTVGLPWPGYCPRLPLTSPEPKYLSEKWIRQISHVSRAETWIYSEDILSVSVAHWQRYPQARVCHRPDGRRGRCRSGAERSEDTHTRAPKRSGAGGAREAEREREEPQRRLSVRCVDATVCGALGCRKGVPLFRVEHPRRGQLVLCADHVLDQLLELVA